MENSIKIKEKKGFFQQIAEIAFMIYLITLYIFVDRNESLIISQIAFIAFAGLTVLVMLQRQRVHIGKNVLMVYITFTWIFATYFWAQNQYLAWVKIKTMWQLFLLFFLTYNLFSEEENAHEYLLKCLYIAGISLIGYSIYIYGLADAINMMLGSRNVRLGRDINQENTFGMMNATTCMVAFYYLFYKKRFKLFHMAVLALAFLFAMSSGSRKALLVVCIGVLFLIYKKYGIRQVYKIIAIVLIVSVVFVSVIQLPVFDTVTFRMKQLLETLLGKGGDSSSQTRTSMISDGWNIFKARMLTGFGVNNYRIVSRYRTYAHNNFIEILVDIGLVGFVLYYLIYWNALKNLWKSKTDAGKALFCIFLVRFMMEIAVVTYYDKLHWIMFAFFLMKPIEPINHIEGENENEIIPEKTEEMCN